MEFITLSKKVRNNDFEVGEDATKYGEFISSYFAWLTLEKQKEKAKDMDKITRKYEH